MKVNARRRSLLALGLVCLVSKSLLATPAGVETLRQMPTQPTVADMLTQLNPWPASNPFQPQEKTNLLPVTKHGPKIIANFELAYPGAVFAPLGRDVVYLGDLLDAFYTGIGQSGRVSRINGSGGTIKGKDSKLLLALLKASGFDPQKFVADPKTPPFIIFDRTSYGKTSQSTQLISAGYQRWAALGQRPQDLFTKFAVISVNSGKDDNTSTLIDAADRAAYFKELLLQPGPIPKSCTKLVFPDSANVIIDRRYAQNSELNWHQSFKQLRLSGDLAFAEPGPQYNAHVKETILWDLYETINAVQDPKFLAEVQRIARELGFEFPLKRTNLELPLTSTTLQTASIQNSLPQVELKIDDLAQQYRTLIKSLGAPAEDPVAQKHLSANAKQLLTWFEQNLNALKIREPQKAEMLVSLFLEGITHASTSELITRKDLRWSIAQGLGHLDLLLGNQPVSQEFRQWFAQQMNQNQTLAKVWTERQAYFLDENPKRHGGLGVVKRYRELSQAPGSTPAAAASKACTNQFISSHRKDLLGGE